MTMNQQLSEDDVMRRLEAYRPTSSLDEWGQPERAAALDTALQPVRPTWTGHAPISRKRRWLTVAGGVAAVGVAVLVIELVPSSDHRQPAGGNEGPGTQTLSSNPAPASGVPSSGPTASGSDSATPAPLPDGAVGRLAAAARSTTLGNPGDGQFWYRKIDLYQPVGQGNAPTIVGSSTNWVAPNGDDWDLQDAGQLTLVHLLPVPRHAEPQPPEHRLSEQPAH